jgi:hypothetical protein
MNARRAIGSMRSSVDRADMTRQIGVSGRPSGSWSAPPGVVARGRNPQDAGHCANGIHGLVRAHEPVNPFGLALLSRANQAAAFARMSRSWRRRWFSRRRRPSSSRSALVGRQCACRRLGRLASPKWKSTGRSARTHAPTPRACVRIAPDQPSVAGTPADKRFGSGASDTSKTTSRVSTKPGQLQLQLQYLVTR